MRGAHIRNGVNVLLASIKLLRLDGDRLVLISRDLTFPWGLYEIPEEEWSGNTIIRFSVVEARVWGIVLLCSRINGLDCAQKAVVNACLLTLLSLLLPGLRRCENYHHHCWCYCYW